MNIHCAEGVECASYDECALLRLRRSTPEIADHIEVMVGKYGLRGVMTALTRQRTHFDSYDFAIMASVTGGSAVEQYEGGIEQEKEVLTQVAACHGIN